MYRESYRRLNELFTNSSYVYIYFESEMLCKEFLVKATNEGFYFTKGKKASKAKPSDIIGVKFDGEMCYVGYTGRRNFNSKECTVPRIDYKKFIDNEKDYSYIK